jgi:hypothetical protein
VLALMLSFFLGTSAKRVLILTAFGVCAVVALVVAALVFAPSSPSTCRECNEYFGRWLSPLTFFSASLNVGAWFGGVLFGASMRSRKTSALDDPPVNDLAYLLVAWSIAGGAFFILLITSLG